MTKHTYADLIDQSYDFPNDIFSYDPQWLQFHGIPLIKLLKKYGSPLKITYLPKIAEQITKTKKTMQTAMNKYNYKWWYTYAYCTKSSHFRFVVQKAVETGAQLEISSAYDTALIRSLWNEWVITQDIMIICNGYKSDQYLSSILWLWEAWFTNIIIVLDNPEEFVRLCELPFEGVLPIGIRVATEEEPQNDMYTSRLWMSSKVVMKLYKEQIKKEKRVKLQMVHFFINSKIKDTPYYRSELSRLVDVYCDLAWECPTLTQLDVGGWFPIQNALDYEFDYAYMLDQIVWTVKHICDANEITPPHIVTEFGSYTVGESGAILYKIIWIKEQNEKELWYMINSSFITTLPDTRGIGQKFPLLALNHRKKPYQSVNLWGITCDSDDYYNKDTKNNQIILPKVWPKDELYIWFFHTGAYQESIGGYGWIQHCLIPAPRHVLIDRDEKGILREVEFAPEQDANEMLRILWYA
jgi:arginine decarboxylase